jgi:hypothetical protein
VIPSDGTDVPLTLVPPFAPMGGVGAPPERASIPTDRTTIPLVTQRGRAVYFANEIGKLAWRFRLPDHTRLIANAVRAAAPRPFVVDLPNAPSGVQLSLFSAPDGRTIAHLVNAVGAGTVRHNVLPIHDLRVRVSGSVSSVRALALDQDLPVVDGVINVPRLDTWEVLVLSP